LPRQNGGGQQGRHRDDRGQREIAEPVRHNPGEERTDDLAEAKGAGHQRQRATRVAGHQRLRADKTERRYPDKGPADKHGRQQHAAGRGPGNARQHAGRLDEAGESEGRGNAKPPSDPAP